MKACVCIKKGSSGVLEIIDIKKPQLKDNEVLIKIEATTVTAGDIVLKKLSLPQFMLLWSFARLVFGIKQLRKKILGHEFSGEIVEIGKKVKLFKKGDLVFGTTGFKGGAHAQYIALPEDGEIILKPEILSHEESAAIPIGGICALNFLRKGNIQKNHKVLIYGASGSVGTYGVQIARFYEAEVTGVCSSANIELVKSLGAHKIIDYTKNDFTKGDEKYDLIFDAVGKLTFFQCKKVLNKNGLFLSTESSPVNETNEELVFLKNLVEAGKLKVVIDQVYPFEQIPKAFEYVEKGRKTGNIIINMTQ